MTKQEIKLPALTRAEIEALPDGAVYVCADGLRIEKWHCPDGPEGERIGFSVFGGGMSPDEVSRAHGGITARLTDPAPLEALLEDVWELLSEVPMSGSAETARLKLCARLNAALEGNDG